MDPGMQVTWPGVFLVLVNMAQTIALAYIASCKREERKRGEHESE